MVRKSHSLVVQLLAGAGFGAAALVARFLLDPLLGNAQPYTPGFVAIALTVWMLGWQGAAVCAGMIFFGANYWFISPRLEWGFTQIHEFASIFTFGTSAGTIILLGHLWRRSEKSLLDANQRLRQADAQKDQALLTLAHELRTPLGVIENARHLLSHHRDNPAEFRRALEMSQRQIRAMTALIQDIIDLERVKAGKLSLSMGQCDVRQCVVHACERYRGASEGLGQTFSMNVPEDAVVIEGDRLRLTQVVANLLDNAVKYAGPDASVRVDVAVQDETVKIEVVDDGVGLTDEAMRCLFSTRLGERVTTTGLGVGLPLCRHIVELHGGRLVVTAGDAGRGVKFTVALPIKRPG